MRRFRPHLLLIFFLVFNLGVVKAQAPPLRGAKMLDCSGLPCVDVTLASGKHLRLLVDTGNVNSILDTQVAKNLGLKVAPAIGADGKPIDGYGISTLVGVNVGDASLGDIKIVVMDVASEVKADHMPAADGALAYTAFKDRLLELDYVRRTVRFSDRLTAELPCPGFCGTLTTPTFGKAGPPIVVSTGFSVNAKPITAQIDTLFSGTMLIYPPSIKKLELSEEAQTTKKQLFKYTDGGVDMMEARAKTEAFGARVLAKDAPLFFATPAVHLPDDLFDATVGHQLFENSVLSLDFHDMRVWLTQES